MASTAGTFAELLALSTNSENSPITLTADIDAYAEGYDLVTDMGSACDIDLNGYTLSNVHLQGSGIFTSSRTVSNGTLLNIYVNGGAVLNLKSVSGSFFLTTSVSLKSIKRCSLDITFSPLASPNRIATESSNTSILSNIVIRNANFVTSTGSTNLLTPTSNFSAIVFENCTFTIPANVSNPNKNLRFSVSGQHSYLVCHNCTLDSAITTAEISSGSHPTYLVCIPFLTTTPTNVIVVSETQLQNREYLEKIGFLP